MATLLVQLPNGVSQVYRLSEKRLALGRSREADISVPARGVSRFHCEVERGPGGEYTLADLGSKNGTSVNDEAIERVVLRHGDVVVIGEARLVFERDGSSSSGPNGAGSREAPPSSAPRWVESPGRPLVAAEAPALSASAAPSPDAEILKKRIGQLENELRRAKSLSGALADFARAPSRARLFERLAERLRELFPLERVFVLSAEDAGGGLRLEYLSGQTETPEAPAIQFSRESVERVMAERSPMVISLYGRDEDGSEGGGGGLRGEATISMLAPVLAGGKAMGAIQADASFLNSMPGRQDLELFQAMAEALGSRLEGLSRGDAPSAKQDSAELKAGNLAPAFPGHQSAVTEELSALGPDGSPANDDTPEDRPPRKTGVTYAVDLAVTFTPPALSERAVTEALGLEPTSVRLPRRKRPPGESPSVVWYHGEDEIETREAFDAALLRIARLAEKRAVALAELQDAGATCEIYVGVFPDFGWPGFSWTPKQLDALAASGLPILFRFYLCYPEEDEDGPDAG